MTRITLVLKFLGLSAFWGLVIGGAMGLIGGLLGGLYIALFVCVLGAITGILLGGLYGVVWGTITAVFFHSGTVESRYKLFGMIAAIAITFPCAFVLFSSSLNYYSAIGRVELWVILIPTTIATIAAGYASQRVSKWYLEQQRSQQSGDNPL